MEIDEMIVPQMVKSRVGTPIPRNTNVIIEPKSAAIPTGREMKMLKITWIASIKHKIMNPKTILQKKIDTGEIGAVSMPFKVPDSFSLIKSFEIVKSTVKKMITHVWTIKISSGIRSEPEPME